MVRTTKIRLRPYGTSPLKVIGEMKEEIAEEKKKTESEKLQDQLEPIDES